MIIRSIEFYPFDSLETLSHANETEADYVMFDLEASVAPENKAAAREMICEYLSSGAFQGKAIVRPNAVDTPYFKEDLEAIVPLPIEGIMLPKMEQAKDILFIDGEMSRIEKEHGLPEGERFIIGVVETALGTLNAYDCLSCCDRIIGGCFGTADYAGSLGVIASADGDELDFPRRMLVISARAANKIPLDTFYGGGDMEGLVKMASQSKKWGYQGKFAVSEEQVPVINEVFTPTAEELDKAIRIRDALEAAHAEGKSMINFEGTIIDDATYGQIAHTLEFAD